MASIVLRNQSSFNGSTLVNGLYIGFHYFAIFLDLDIFNFFFYVLLYFTGIIVQVM